MKLSSKPSFSIVIPFYNEKKSIIPLVEKYKVLRKKYTFELLCVNNGSTDSSEEIFQTLSRKKEYSFLKIIHIKKNIGYGHGIMTGVRAAKGEVIAWTHADMQTLPQDVFRAYDLYCKYKNIHVLVKGNRRKRNVIDTSVSFCMGIIASSILLMPLYEINAQPKVFHRSLLDSLPDTPDDFMLDLYLLFQAKRNNYRIYTIPVEFPPRLYGKSKWAYSFPSRLKMIGRTIGYIFYLTTL